MDHRFDRIGTPVELAAPHWQQSEATTKDLDTEFLFWNGKDQGPCWLLLHHHPPGGSSFLV